MRRTTQNAMPRDSIDSQWARFTQAGNESLERGNLLDAQRYYERALTEASAMFDKAHSESAACHYAPMTYNIAAFNLATLFNELGNKQMMHRYARSALEHLIEVAEQRNVPQELRLQCIQHLGRAVITLEQLFPGAQTHPDYRVLVANADLLQRKFDVRAGLYSIPSASERGAIIH
ncbi:hypothetical protein [Halomonas colorata]|uniref:Tetratricopeptide repeat protein n=1 Tax=Halomonas colorata TaxID=2742615 RepID=A0ABR9G3M5_9GAMM|nr:MULTISPECIES: hypothetical protein [Halomonas]ASK17907.1 hypothetical protein CEK60_00670 [Halomonas sp. N3-2A]MBE0465479.1 hypothetical protein [Halomonas colorata]